MEKTTRRYGLGTRVFATDPWTVIRRSIEKRCLAASQKAALALLEQSEDFYRAAESGVKAAKPLLLYYCFMNLAKAYILTLGYRPDVNDAQHGLSEKLDDPPNNKELLNAYLYAYQSTPPPNVGAINVFDDVLRALSGQGLAANPRRFDLPILLSQVVPGHRLWAAGAKTKERFVSLERIDFWQHKTDKEIWLRLYLVADDLKRIDLSHQLLLERTSLDGVVHEVVCDEKLNSNRALIRLEQLDTVACNHRPSDSVPELVARLRHRLWRTVLAMPPYRKYYLYPAPIEEHPQVLPQILSIYAIAYYLGSITRYRPHHFDVILSGPFGPFIEAFLNDQPTQFIYLMASEFAEQEVTKAAIV
jgi:YaaC-like Protein